MTRAVRAREITGVCAVAVHQFRPYGMSALLSPSALVGREDDLRVLDDAYAATAMSSPGVVLVEGEAGIGKSSLLRAFAARHDDARPVVLEGLEFETDVEYGVVDSLFRTLGLEHDVLATRRSHIEVGLVVLEALSALPSPVLLVLDDAQWIDGASLRALVFALRRASAERLLAVFAAREDADALPDGVRRLAEAHGTVVRLGSLTEADLSDLTRQYGIELSGATLRALHEHTGGSPLYARALLEEVPAEHWHDPTLVWPAPRRLAGLVEARMGALSQAGRRLVNAVAVIGSSTTLDACDDVAAAEDAATALDEAVKARLLRIEARDGVPVIAFSHPLYQAAAYEQIAPLERRTLHLRAAATTSDVPAALRHRAAAALGSDRELAAELIRAAEHEASQGGHALAASLLWRASGLANERTLREHCRLAAIDHTLRAGMATRARAMARDIAGYEATALRHFVEGHLALLSRDPGPAGPLFQRAWEACTEPRLKVEIGRFSRLWHMLQLESVRVLEWSARTVADTPPDGAAAALANGPRAMSLGYLGRMPEALALLDTLEPGAREFAGAFSGWLKLVDDDLEGGTRRSHDRHRGRPPRGALRDRRGRPHLPDPHRIRRRPLGRGARAGRSGRGPR